MEENKNEEIKEEKKEEQVEKVETKESYIVTFDSDGGEIKEKSKEGNVVLDGLYSWDELAILKEGIKDNLTIICIVVDKDIRYSRVTKRKERSLTAKEVNDRDIAEIEQIAKGGPIAYADYYILNNGDLEEYKKRLDEILKKIDTKGVN